MLQLSNYRRHRRRRGVGSLLFMLFLTIFILLLMLVVNYTYLAYSQLRTGEVTDTLARIAATELLDESVFDSDEQQFAANQGSPQADDVAQSQTAVADYLAKLNLLADARQHLRYDATPDDADDSDVFVSPGRVEDASAPITSATFQPYDPSAQAIRLNTLAIEASRSATGTNPLYMLVRNTLMPQTATIGTTSYATLDSRVIGFQPTAKVNVPIIPIGILDTAWKAQGARGADHGGKPRKDFRGSIKDSAGGNLVLLDFHQNGPAVQVDTAFTDRILNGLDQGDIEIHHTDTTLPDYFLGPVVEGTMVKVANMPVQGTLNGADALTLESALNVIADPDLVSGERRIFPLCSTATGGTTDIVGFVAARIVGVDYQANKLQVDLEPEFVVHFTAVTAFHYADPADGNAPEIEVPENVYIHKLRLSR
jgi:Flp pilus assembly protein TadG